MIGCLRTRVRKQPIIALYFESETHGTQVLKPQSCTRACEKKIAGSLLLINVEIPVTIQQIVHF